MGSRSAANSRNAVVCAGATGLEILTLEGDVIPEGSRPVLEQLRLLIRDESDDQIILDTIMVIR